MPPRPGGDAEQHLISMVYHTDGRVNAIEQQVGVITTALARIEQHLMNKPPTNWAAWIGVFMTLTFGLVAGVYATGEYVNLQLLPVREEVSRNRSVIDEFHGFQKEVYYNRGRSDALVEAQLRKNEKVDIQLRTLQDHVQRIDSEGSRKWKSLEIPE